MKACLIMSWEMEGQLRQRHFWHIQRIWFWNKALLTKQRRRLFCQNLKSSSCQILEISAFCFLLAPGNPASLNFSCAPTGALVLSSILLVHWCYGAAWCHEVPVHFITAANTQSRSHCAPLSVFKQYNSKLWTGSVAFKTASQVDILEFHSVFKSQNHKIGRYW